MIFDDNNHVNNNTQAEEQKDASQENGQTQEVEFLKQELKTAQDKALYLAADFDNIRRRLEKDKFASIDNAYKTMLLDIVSIVDDFERAFADIKQKPELASYMQGFEMIYKAFQKMLTQYNVREIDNVTIFDPEFHEAVMHVTDSDKTSGHIVTMFEKGYLYKNQLLRPAKVSVQG